MLAFGDSLTRGYYNKGKNHHPYTMKLQYLLNKMDAKRCFIVENEGRDGDMAFGEMPKRMEEFFDNSSKNNSVYKINCFVALLFVFVLFSFFFSCFFLLYLFIPSLPLTQQVKENTTIV